MLGALGVGLVFYIVQWLLEPAAMRTETGAHGADALDAAVQPAPAPAPGTGPEDGGTS